MDVFEIPIGLYEEVASFDISGVFHYQKIILQKKMCPVVINEKAVGLKAVGRVVSETAHEIHGLFNKPEAHKGGLPPLPPKPYLLSGLLRESADYTFTSKSSSKVSHPAGWRRSNPPGAPIPL